MKDRIVLVVDDEPNITRLCQRLLEKSEYQVVAATSASQALAIISRMHLDLLLLDIRMPELDGFQLLSMARQQQPDLAAVVMTGFGTIETAVAALNEGADGLVLKPFSRSELLSSVQRALKDNQTKRDAIRLRALRPLFELTEALFSETDVPRLERLILEAVMDHLSCSYAVLYRYEVEKDEFHLVLGRGDPVNFGECFSSDDFMKMDLIEGRPIWINQSGSGRDKYRKQLKKLKLSSILCAPLQYKDGRDLIIASRSVDQPEFSQADFEMLLILIRQSVLALENAHLYEKLTAYIGQIEQSKLAMNQAEKMASVGRLTSSIAHEINNPLQSLNNYLHLAQRQEIRESERLSYLKIAQDELERLMSLVQRMLEFYRPGVRDKKVRNVNQIIQRVCQLIEPQLSEQNISIRLDLRPSLPNVLVVENQIQQVLLNLLLNAMEALSNGGEIQIQTNVFRNEFGLEPLTKKAVEIVIKDTGPGIPENERDNIFEPFYSTKENGTGLGLAVSYGIISAHGGSLELVEGSEAGACFRIILPEEHQNES